MPRRAPREAPADAKYPRIPFATAISDPLLMQKGFLTMSPPQGTILKIIYGMDLTTNERRYWNAFNGYGIYDELGYLVDLSGELPYEPREYEDITLIVGRRSGKTERISAFIVAYEALFGGHKAHLLNKKQDPIFLQVAQDLVTAKSNLRQFILHWVEQSPVGLAELAKRKTDATTAEHIRLDMGLITVGPPSIKLRSQAIAVCAMDELAVWPKDREAANPDVEVEIAVRPAMAQFPYRKLIKTSTPWTEEGLLWDAAQKGTHGRFLTSVRAQQASSKVLVLRAPTAAMENPAVPRAYLLQERSTDADAFRRENLAEFSKSVTSFLSPALLRAAVTPGLLRREPMPGYHYIATMDPAFRRDAFAFTICHLEGGRLKQDFAQALRGTKDNPLSPRFAVREFSQICKTYGVHTIITDQYHMESLQDLALDEHITVHPSPLTAKLKQQMWGDFAAFLTQGRLDLLDDPEQLEELLMMEKHLTPGGTIQYHGKRDDRAMVLALGVHKALQQGELRPKDNTATASLSSQVRDRIVNRHEHHRAWWN